MCCFLSQGTNSVKLHLTHLEAGLYQFKLVVTDTTGQTAMATVTVDVQEGNKNYESYYLLIN